jgi:Fe-S-cluster containining protein
MPNGSDDAIKRKELERALRHLNVSDADVRDALLQLAARVVALTEELDRRTDGTLEAAVDAAVPDTLARIRMADSTQQLRLELDPDTSDKYAAVPATPPCEELMPICQARCCKQLTFALSTQDLDEGLIRWDYGRPYRVRRRSDGYCVHNDATSHGCTTHGNRPRVCRTYDCRNDKRIWTDFENRVLAPPDTPGEPREIDLVERIRQRALAVHWEDLAVRGGNSED